jgi:thymidylate synthase (FAD)
METGRPTIPAAEEILGKYFPALDHGFVALVDYMGGDEAIDDAARTSYGAGTRKVSERRGLLRTLRRNLHTSPFEMCALKFHCSMPIFVARQWIRHRTASVNEYSGRYSVVPMLFYTPNEEQLNQQSKTNKQGRGAPVGVALGDVAIRRLEDTRNFIREDYTWMVANDFARELARIDLPLSTYTQWYWKIDLHNLLHFLGLRCDQHAQYEIRVFADLMAGMVKRVAPLSFEAWIDYTFTGARMSRMELELLYYFLQQGGLYTNYLLVEKKLTEVGLSKREISEFFTKLEPKKIPSFDLDLSTAKDGIHFQRIWEDAVPKIDKVGT